MQKRKNVTRKITAIAMALIVLCIANATPVLAAAPNNGSASTYGVITPWHYGDGYITLDGHSHSSDLFGVKAGNTARVEVTVTEVSGQYSEMGLGVSLIRQYPNRVIEQTIHFYGTGNHTYTFTASAGGSYCIQFYTRAGSRYTFTYKITY